MATAGKMILFFILVFGPLAIMGIMLDFKLSAEYAKKRRELEERNAKAKKRMSVQELQEITSNEEQDTTGAITWIAENEFSHPINPANEITSIKGRKLFEGDDGWMYRIIAEWQDGRKEIYTAAATPELERHVNKRVNNFSYFNNEVLGIL